MLNSSPIRVLLTSSRRSRREVVRASLKALGRFEFFESTSASRLAHDVTASHAQIVLLIQPEIQDVLSDYLGLPAGPSRVPVIAIGKRGTKEVSNQRMPAGVSGFLPLQELNGLPELMQRLLERRAPAETAVVP